MQPLKALMALVLIGCATFGGPSSSHPISPIHEYDVYIDPHCSPAQHLSITQSFEEWEVNTHRMVRFYPVDHAKVGRPFIGVWCQTQEQLNKMHPPKNSIDGLATYHGYDTIILLLDTMNERDFHSVALHELGHALGLSHPKDPHKDTVMAAYLGEDLIS